MSTQNAAIPRASAAPAPDERRSSTLLTALIALFFLTQGIFRSFHHAMWEDEWWLWLRACSQHSLAQALASTRYDGHPPGWYLLIYLVTRFTSDPLYLKLFHTLIASSSIFLIWWIGPFSRLEKLLLPLGYFFFFEYLVISRSYALGVTLALCCAITLCRRRENYWLLALLVLAMAQLSLHGLILGLAIIAGCFDRSLSRRQLLLLVSWALTALLLFFIETRPPADATTGQLLNAAGRLHPFSAATGFFYSLFPLPPNSLHWWNRSLVPLADPAAAILASVLFFAGIFSLNTRRARVVFITGSLLLYLSALLIYTGSMRHWGHFFILYLVALWIDRGSGQVHLCRQRRFFIPLLIVQAIAGIMAARLAHLYPFTSAPQAAQLISVRFPDLPVAGDFDYALTPIAGNLNRPIWIIRSNQFGWSPRFDNHRRRNVTIAMIENQVHDLAERENRDVLLVMTYAIPLPKEFELVAHVPPATVESEDYYIYLYRRTAEPQSGQRSGVARRS